MKQITTIVLSIIFSIFFLKSQAHSIKVPTWENLLENSDVIAIIEFTSNGVFEAKAKILSIYKGGLKVNDEIWISSKYFDFKYSFENKVKGDKYLVFLNMLDSNIFKNEHINDEYHNAIFKNKAYHVKAPICGHLKIKKDKVQYDLTTSINKEKQSYYSLSEFEYFINCYLLNESRSELIENLLSQLNPVSKSKKRTQILMKLYFLGYNHFIDVFYDYSKINDSDTKYALAKLMGNINNESSNQILINYLTDNDFRVQQLAINLLGELKCKQAIPNLLKLLETENSYLFEIVVDVLRKNGNKEYIAYINKHLENTEKNKLSNVIRYTIEKDGLIECLPSLMNYIANCNRTEYTSDYYLIKTLTYFKDTSITSFLLKDFGNYLEYKNTISPNIQTNWLIQYIEAFEKLKLASAKPLIYKCIYDWFGVNQYFGMNKNLFGLKKQEESVLRDLFEKRIDKYGYKLSSCIAYIQNYKDIDSITKPITKYKISVTIPQTKKIEPIFDIISKELQIEKECITLMTDDGWASNQVPNNYDKTPLLDSFKKYISLFPSKNDDYILQQLTQE